MADRTRLSGTQAGGRAGTFCRTGLARLPPSRHPLHCGVRIPDLRARDDSPLRRSCHHALPAICLTPRLPAQRMRRCGLNATFRTRLQRCDGDWWPLWQRRSRVAHAALLATDTQICDTVRLRDESTIGVTGSVLNGWGFTTTFEMLHCSVQPASNIASDIAKGAFRRTPRFGTKPASYCSRALPKIRALNQMQAAGGIARAAPGP